MANSPAVDKLNLLPNPPKENADNYLRHNEIWKIMVWCKNEGITFDVFWQWNAQKSNSQQRMVKYYHLWNNTSSYKINESYIDALLITVYPELQRDIHKRRFKKINTIHHSNKVKSKFLSSANVTDVKYSFLDVRMGDNKTGSVSDYIQQANFKRVLFIVPRIALLTIFSIGSPSSPSIETLKTNFYLNEKVCIFLPYKFIKPRKIKDSNGLAIYELTRALADKFKWHILTEAEKTHSETKISLTIMSAHLMYLFPNTLLI